MAIASITTVSAALPTLGDPTLDNFSRKDEQQFGLAFYRSLRANLVFIEDLQINYYLSSLGQRLASHSDAAGDTFHFFIIKAPTINAFAGPAAYIGIHTQLILEAKNESQLASVLAHEIAHVSQRHLARAFDNSGQSTALTIATLLAAILIGTQDPQAGQAILMTGIASSQQSSINFTRSNEYEADRVGIGILGDTGINPQGMVEFFEILLDNSPEGGIEYLRTHPLGVNRVSEAKNRLDKKNSHLPKDNLDFQLTKARLIIMLSHHPEYYLDDNLVGAGLVGQYQKALAAMRAQKSSLAIKILNKLSKQHQHPWIKLALAEAYTNKGANKKALKVLNALAKLYPGYLPATMALVKALNNNNMPDKSIPLLKNQLQIDDFGIIYEALAKAYYANGQIAAALESTGNQYARQGYIELAIQQYNNALHQEGISKSTKHRLEAAKDALKNVMQH
ncbi:Exported zinc metalloprotease YfgC precursor [hydrothermal vent metagenome]|uniref:Exported zinc metalloprotease YfgC n=1 Tax=hydrothermal vent metagenome TaxID=652676 RepID=A0A3B0XCS7_9ZZZZ